MELFIGLAVGLLASLMVASTQGQSQADSRHRDAVVQQEKANAESMQLYKDSTARHDKYSTELMQTQKEILKVLEEVVSQQKQTNRLLGSFKSRS